jgi:cyanophycinase
VSDRTQNSPGPIALVGSGEFLPQMQEVDRWLLGGRTQRAAFLPTAAGLEGPESIDHWMSLGTNHYAGLGVEPVQVAVLNRTHAEDSVLADLLNDVGLVYLSGGNPGYLSNSLRDTVVWKAIVAAWQNGAALAGCSAGAMALTAHAPKVHQGQMTPSPGLALLPHLSVLPHFDQMPTWVPGFMDRAIADQQPGITTVGIDEDTALVGGPYEWTVMGRLQVTVFGPSGLTTYGAGSEIVLPG